MVLFGREYCDARKPRCGECPLREECAFGREETVRTDREQYSQKSVRNFEKTVAKRTDI